MSSETLRRAAITLMLVICLNASVVLGRQTPLELAGRGLSAAADGLLLFRQCVESDPALAATVLFPDTSNIATFQSEAHSVWNTFYNTTRLPAAVARPTDSEQVAALVQCANNATLRMVVRGGGHSYEAMSLINNGVIIDLEKLQHIWLTGTGNTAKHAQDGAADTSHSVRRSGSSPAASPKPTAESTPDQDSEGEQTTGQRVRHLAVGAGLRMGPIYAYLFEHGLTMEGPTCPSLGVSGATLGGGTGHSTRRLGLLADQVRSAEVVTMNGTIRPVDSTTFSDLFWALRGGGANYAIVTAWQFEVVPAPANITYASLSRDPTAANLSAVLKAFTAWQPWLLDEEVARVHIGMFSDKVMLELWLWDPDTPTNSTASEQTALALLAAFQRATQDLPAPKEQVLLPRSFESYMLSQAVTDCYGVPESEWGWANVSTNEATTAADHYWRTKYTGGQWPFKGGSAVFLGSVPPEVWDDFAPVMMSRVANASSFTRAVLIGAGGHQRRLPNNATGFGFRDMTMQIEVGTQATTPADAAWVDRVLTTVQPASGGRKFWNHFECLDSEQEHRATNQQQQEAGQANAAGQNPRTGPDGVPANILDSAAEFVWRAYFGENAGRLLDVKAKWDRHGRINAMNCSALN